MMSWLPLATPAVVARSEVASVSALAFTEIGCIVVSGRAAGADAAEAAGEDGTAACCAQAQVFSKPKPAAIAPSGSSRRGAGGAASELG
jgi:hypothetical protein